MGNSNYTVYGTERTGNNTFRSVNLHSGYRWDGFNMGAYYTKGNAQATIPQIVAGQLPNRSPQRMSYGANLSHHLPWNGSAPPVSTDPTGTAIIWATTQPAPSTR